MPSASRTIASETATALLLPGLLCDQAVWAGQIAALSPGVRCLVAEYGEIDSLPQMAQAALALAPPRFILMGHSMGGRVALEIMRTAGARVSALALLDTGYQGRPSGAAGEAEVRARQGLVQLARSRGMRAMGEVWVQDMVLRSRLADAALVESILGMVERRTPRCWRRRYAPCWRARRRPTCYRGSAARRCWYAAARTPGARWRATKRCSGSSRLRSWR